MFSAGFCPSPIPTYPTFKALTPSPHSNPVIHSRIKLEAGDFRPPSKMTGAKVCFHSSSARPHCSRKIYPSAAPYQSITIKYKEFIIFNKCTQSKMYKCNTNVHLNIQNKKPLSLPLPSPSPPEKFPYAYAVTVVYGLLRVRCS